MRNRPVLFLLLALTISAVVQSWLSVTMRFLPNIRSRCWVRYADFEKAMAS